MKQTKTENLLRRLLIVANYFVDSDNIENCDTSYFLALIDECERRGAHFEGLDFFEDNCPLCIYEKCRIVIATICGHPQNRATSGFVDLDSEDDKAENLVGVK